MLIHKRLQKYSQRPRAQKRYRNEEETSDEEEQEQVPRRLKKPEVYLESNHIYFRGNVTTRNVTDLCDYIDKYNQEILNLHSQSRIVVTYPCPLYVHITSVGGDLMGGLMAFDYIKRSNLTIYTVAEGYTISSGGLIFMAGKKRLMTRNSYFLAHQLRQMLVGTYTAFELQDEGKNDTELMERLYHVYLDNLRPPPTTPQTELLTTAKLEEHMRHDIFWNFETCAKYGIVDEEYVNCVERDRIDRSSIVDAMQTHLVNANANHVSFGSIKECSLKPSKTMLKHLADLRTEMDADNEEAKEMLAKQLGKILANNEDNPKVSKKQKKPKK